jgi:hypothetical protein
MSQLATCKAQTGLVRRENHNGKTFVISPVIAIRQGVLNGELALADEIGRYPAAWNGIPLPLGHPVDQEGNPISANQPDLVAQCPGRFWFAHMDDDRLAGEVWIDEAEAKRIGGDAVVAVNRLIAGTPIEVSTAYFRDLDETAGEYEGTAYVGIQRNMRPDHLALLLHERGACDWNMGCGCPRINTGGSMEPRVIQINLDLSLDEQLSVVYDAFRTEFYPPQPPEPEMYIREVYADRVIARTADGLMAYPYTVNADGTVAFGTPVAVELVYQEVSTNQAQAQETVVAEAAGAEAAGAEAAAPETNAATPCPLATNCNCPRAQAGEEPVQEPPATTAESATPAEPAANSDAAPALIALAQEYGGLEAMREMLQEFRANQETARNGLVSEIVAHSTLAENDLQAMGLEGLQKLRDSLRPAANDYSGRGGPRSRQSGGEIVESPMPTLI